MTFFIYLFEFYFKKNFTKNNIKFFWESFYYFTGYLWLPLNRIIIFNYNFHMYKCILKINMQTPLESQSIHYNKECLIKAKYSINKVKNFV